MRRMILLDDLLNHLASTHSSMVPVYLDVLLNHHFSMRSLVVLFHDDDTSL